jgi:dTDP-4-amino-4,6-dideoxygalactose transaminase
MKNIPLFKVFTSPDLEKPLLDVIKSGYVTEGPKVAEFEYFLRRWLDVQYLNTTNSGTSALVLALKASGLQPGKKVISTPYTCSATNLAARVCLGDIVWADIDPTTGNIDPNSVEDRLKTNTDVCAIMAVHWGGYPCDLTALNYLAKKYNVPLIEDAAHAFGSIYRGKKIGTHSDMVAFSFQAIKTLTTVDGGAIICRDADDHKYTRLARWFGIDRDAPREDLRCEMDITVEGSKYHMNDLNATIGLSNLPYIDTLLFRQRNNGFFYDAFFAGEDGITPTTKTPDRLSSYWLYTVLIKGGRRDAFMKKMTERGIMISKVHSRNDTHSVFDPYKSELPGVEKFAAEQVNIPCGWWVTPEDAEYIAHTAREVMKEI